MAKKSGLRNYKIKIEWNQSIDLSQARALYLFQRANTAAGLAVLEDVSHRFSTEGAPPKRWTALKAATIRRRTEGTKRTGNRHLPGTRILQDSGTLARSLQDGQRGNVFKSSPKSVLVGTNIVYAGVHQFGYSTRNIPQRKFIYGPKEVPSLNRELNDIYYTMLKSYVIGKNQQP